MESSPMEKRQLNDATLLPVYIAANTSSFENFAVGDERSYGGYKNYELKPVNSYYVAIAVLIENQQVRFTGSIKLVYVCHMLMTTLMITISSKYSSVPCTCIMEKNNGMFD